MTVLRFLRFPLAAAFLLVALAAQAQHKVGIINLQQALLDTAEMKKAQADMEVKFKPRQEAIDKLQREIQELQRQLQTMQGKLQPAAEQDMVATGQRKQRELQRLTEDLQGDVDAERNIILSRGRQRIQEVVGKLAEEKTLDVVLDTTVTVYSKAALDITKEATAAYDKAFPLK
jgi:outer membrane protein